MLYDNMIDSMDQEKPGVAPIGIGDTIGFFGNAGKGKSTLLNILANNNVFKSSISLNGKGVTQEHKVYNIGNSTLIDSPGLNDPIDKQKAADEIKKSLRENINYKVIFVCGLESGRLNEDLTTINIILNAIDIDKKKLHYGIIYNNVTKRVKDIYEASGELIRIHMNQLPVPPKQYIILEKLIELEDNEDVLSTNESFNNRLKEFINTFSPSTFPQNSIRDINPEMYDEISQKLEERFHKLLQEKDEEMALLRAEFENKLKDSIKSIEEEFKQEVTKNIEKDGVTKNETSFRKMLPEKITTQEKKTFDQVTYFKRLVITKYNGEVIETKWAEYNKSEIETSTVNIETHSEFRL